MMSHDYDVIIMTS